MPLREGDFILTTLFLLSMSAVTACPDCHFKINLEGGEIGDYFECEECLCDLTITSLDPAKVEMVMEEK